MNNTKIIALRANMTDDEFIKEYRFCDEDFLSDPAIEQEDWKLNFKKQFGKSVSDIQMID